MTTINDSIAIQFVDVLLPASFVGLDKKNITNIVKKRDWEQFIRL
jgi:hypothetical protein